MGAIRSLPRIGWLAGLWCCACALPAAADGVRRETVRFADPRWPAVQVVRGAPAAVLPPVQVVRGAPAATLPPAFKETPANTELVTFGDGTGSSVKIVRGGITAPPAPRIESGRVETVRFAGLGAPAVNIVRGGALSDDGIGLFNLARGGELDRVAFAVDGAESGHGSNLAMWRPEFDGPQGPMQVSAAAALDVGGGDRFDMSQNRVLGRAFLAKMYQRYGNWPDAIAAYNWGPGHLDQWIANGRPTDALPLETARYMLKVLRDALLLGPS
ncbi:MAG TPA: lytic transglycosylase domain-containing protein [Xanthobacteraceae bacterium]|nr:lytic transglycosylase domain-containing protein [Xanthobacteraceae bacterium]